jgi:hypothetical protein
MWFRKYFWVAKFDQERKKFGKSVFRTREERLQIALDLYADNSLVYTIYRYNCEYFVRRCVFNNQKLWASNQTMALSQSRVALYTKITSILIFNIFHKFNNDLEYERDKKPDEYLYMCDKKGRIRHIKQARGQ